MPRIGEVTVGDVARFFREGDVLFTRNYPDEIHTAMQQVL